MKLSEVKEEFRVYVMSLSNGNNYQVTGDTKNNILKSPLNYVEIPNGSVVNKAFIIDFRLDFGLSRDLVEKNKDKLLK